MAPFTGELGEETKMLFLLCKALKARVAEKYYYGCFLFPFSLWVLRICFFNLLGEGGNVVGRAASAGEVFI